MGNVIDLSKKARIVLEKKKIETVQAQLILAIDISGSMTNLYRNGVVQEVVDRLLAIGMNMDVDKSIDIFAFNSRGHHVGTASQENHQSYVSNHITKMVGGSTNYAPVMRMIVKQAGFGEESNDHAEEESGSLLKRFFGRKKENTTPSAPTTPTENPSIPTFVFFITDGDNFDPNETESLIKKVSKDPIFWQFVGIGKERMSFLEKLDNMPGRFLDNANFFRVNDISNIEDEELYNRILNEFPSWLKDAKEKGILS